MDDVHGVDVVNGDGTPEDNWGHGTHCAGIAAGTGGGPTDPETGLRYVGAAPGAYLLNIFALRHVPPTVVSIYIYLQPLLTTGLSWWVSQRGGADYTADLSRWTALCAVAIFTGVALVSLPNRTHH